MSCIKSPSEHKAKVEHHRTITIGCDNYRVWLGSDGCEYINQLKKFSHVGSCTNPIHCQNK